jgi:hypothetical protein
LVIWSFLAGNRKIVKFRQNPNNFGKVGILEATIFLNKSLNNKLYEYEAIFEQLFSEKKLFDFKVDFNY